MQPLSPKDLLIRQAPVDTNQWDDTPKDDTSPVVSLERFQTLERVIRETPLTVEPYLELARIYLASARWNDARRILDIAVERFPEDEDANFLLEEAQISRSLQLVSVAQNEHDAEPTRLTSENLERCQLELNVLRERVCRNRLQRHPDQVELLIPLSIALENLGNRDEAIRMLQQAVKVPELRAEAALQLGQMLERARRIPDALSAYRRAAFFRCPAPKDETRYQALLAAANLAERSLMIDSARRYVELLLQISPSDSELLQRFRNLEQQSLEFTQAVRKDTAE